MGNPSTSLAMTFLLWLSLAAIIWLQSISGTNSDFSEYSSQLKSRLGITQLQLGYLAVASDAGKLFAFFSGFAVQYLPLPYVLMIGASIGLVGYGVPFLFMAGKIAAFTYWQAVLLSMLAGNSICWINTACYVASMRNFRGGSSAAVVGLSTSYSALTPKIYIAISQAIRGNHDTEDNRSIYLLLNSITPLLVGLVTAPLFMEKIPAAAATGVVSGASFTSLFVIACATGAYSIVMTLVPALRGRLGRAAAVVLLVVIAAVVVVPLLKAVRWMREKGRRAMKVAVVEDEMVEVGSMVEEDEEEEEEEKGREYGVRELLRSVDFWIYFLVYLTGGTLGLVFMNNLGQIAQSRGVSDTFLLSISSCFTFFGKLASAPLSALTRSKCMVSTPALMASLMPPMAGAFFLLLERSTTSLLISTAIIGMCSGAMTSIAISMTAELFGHKRFSVNHNILIANIPIGSLIFGYIAGYIYDKERDMEHLVGTCFGVQCYKNTFILWGFICSVGTVLSYVLYCRTRRLVVPSLANPVLHNGRASSHDPESEQCFES